MFEKGVEKMPLAAKAVKVGMSLMMSWRPAFKMGGTRVLKKSGPVARSVRVTVSELGEEGHIYDAMLGLCWRAALKMTTGGEVWSNVKGREALGSASAVAFGQSSGCCRRLCRPFW